MLIIHEAENKLVHFLQLIMQCTSVICPLFIGQRNKSSLGWCM